MIVVVYKVVGVYVVVLVNDEDLLLVEIVDIVIVLKVGLECLVVVIKFYICVLVVFVVLIVVWVEDEVLCVVVDLFFDLLMFVFGFDWMMMVEVLVEVSNLFVIGCGYGYGIV